MSRGKCRICGCVEDDGCSLGEVGAGIICHWVERDLCSACAPAAAIIEVLDGSPADMSPAVAGKLRHAANEFLDMLDKPRI